MEQSDKLVGVFQGSWLSEDGEHVASIEGFEIQWPDGSSKQLALDETDEDRFTFELEDQVFGGRLVSEDRLEFTDGDVWIRAKKVEAKPKRKSAPRKPPVPLDGTEPIKPKRKAAPRKRKAAPAEEKAKKFKVTSKNKVGILSKPEIEAEVKTYLMPGAVFMAEEEWVDPRDERKYFFITAEHGWVPQCSRKDPSKVVVEEQISKAKRARMEAEQAAAAAAALEAEKAAEEAAARGEPEAEEPEQQAEEKVEEGLEETAAAADVAAEEAAPPTP